MSGIAGLLNLDGAPVDAARLTGLTAAMAYRGPDRQDTWTDGAVGLGHALLRTFLDGGPDLQPCTLDGAVWIVADVRLDARADLKQRLEGAGAPELRQAGDAELILHAYGAWGDACVERLLGDFVFALWDTRARRLLCARDPFGVKPFYYAVQGHAFSFSNTFHALACHAGVTRDLDESAVADVLLFGNVQDETATLLREVRRLPPGHRLVCADGTLTVTRYWAPTPVDTVQYRQADEYGEHFNELFDLALADRLRTDKAAIYMSGGMDSTAIAAQAVRSSRTRGLGLDLQAFTVVYDRLFHDEERHYAGLAARHLGLPIHFLPADDYPLIAPHALQTRLTPEPSGGVLAGITFDQWAGVASHARVALGGQGGDVLFHPSLTHFPGLLRRGRVIQALLDAGGHYARFGRLPALGLRSRLKRAIGLGPASPAFPSWLEPSFRARLGLEDRWRAYHAPGPGVRNGSSSESVALLSGPAWSALFERCDPGVTGLPVEKRYPFLDQRLVRFCLGLPNLPWRDAKHLLREATAATLPEEVRQRPKTVLAGDPIRLVLRAGDTSWRTCLEDPQWLAPFVDVPALGRLLARLAKGGPPSAGSCVTAPLDLACWVSCARLIEPR